MSISRDEDIWGIFFFFFFFWLKETRKGETISRANLRVPILLQIRSHSLQNLDKCYLSGIFWSGHDIDEGSTHGTCFCFLRKEKSDGNDDDDDNDEEREVFYKVCNSPPAFPLMTLSADVWLSAHPLNMITSPEERRFWLTCEWCLRFFFFFFFCQF